MLNGVSVSIPPNITACQIGGQFHVMSWRRFRWRMVESQLSDNYTAVSARPVQSVVGISCIMACIVLFRLSGNYMPLYQPTLSAITLLAIIMEKV